MEFWKICWHLINNESKHWLSHKNLSLSQKYLAKGIEELKTQSLMETI